MLICAPRSSFRSDIVVHYEKTYTPAAAETASASPASSRGKPAQATVQSFGKSEPVSYHLDSITDLLVSEVPYPVVISSSLDGTIKVWK